jgi:hypothetical protein
MQETQTNESEQDTKIGENYSGSYNFLRACFIYDNLMEQVET